MAGRSVNFAVKAVRTAWLDSSIGAAARSIRDDVSTLPGRAWVRSVAIAVGVAAGLQPVLIGLMPATVAPAVPRPAFIIVAVFAALAAWWSEAIANAWPNAMVARWIRR